MFYFFVQLTESENKQFYITLILSFFFNACSHCDLRNCSRSHVNFREDHRFAVTTGLSTICLWNCRRSTPYQRIETIKSPPATISSLSRPLTPIKIPINTHLFICRRRYETRGQRDVTCHVWRLALRNYLFNYLSHCHSEINWRPGWGYRQPPKN